MGPEKNFWPRPHMNSVIHADSGRLTPDEVWSHTFWSNRVWFFDYHRVTRKNFRGYNRTFSVLKTFWSSSNKVSLTTWPKRTQNHQNDLCWPLIAFQVATSGGYFRWILPVEKTFFLLAQWESSLFICLEMIFTRFWTNLIKILICNFSNFLNFVLKFFSKILCQNFENVLRVTRICRYKHGFKCVKKSVLSQGEYS